MENAALAVLGSFVSLLLMINAFFTRKTLEKITDVELKLAVLIAKHDTTEERSKNNEKDIDVLKEKIHSLEGATLQMLEYIKTTRRES